MESWIEWLWAPLLGAAMLLLALAWRLRRWRRRWRWIAILPLLLLALPLAGAGGYAAWYVNRPLPAEVDRRSLFAGITYTRQVVRKPNLFILHLVEVDLQQPGVSPLVTPPNGPAAGHVTARTTSQFLEAFDVQVAINAAFFYPWSPGSAVADGYPRAGEPVNVCGRHVSGGEAYGDADPRYTALSFLPDGRAVIGPLHEDAAHAVAGLQVFLEGGRVVKDLDRLALPYAPSPRTAVAIDRTGRRLILAVVDGRQPNYSEGVSLPVLARTLRDRGAWTALNLDGGGSSTLVIEGPDGQPVVLNSPIHDRIPPGQQRPVANHLGLRAGRSD